MDSKAGRTLAKAICVISVLTALAVPACSGEGAGRDKAGAPDAGGKAGTEVTGNSLVTVYYFHTTARCATCNMFEQLVRDVVETDFSGNVGDGRITFECINVDEEGNRHYVRDYKLYTKSVVLSKREGGEETSWKNLDKIWELARNRDELREYVRAAIAESLAG